MGTFKMQGYDTFSGCDIIVTSRLAHVHDNKVEEKVYVLGSIQTISVSTHQDKRPVRAIGNINALDYTMGQRTIAGSLVFAVFNKHFADEMIKDLQKITGKMVLLADELPPLDITITFANEYGRRARMAVFGMRLIDEGQVMSVNDVYTENTYQFVATSLEPLNDDLTRYSSNTNKSSTAEYTGPTGAGKTNFSTSGKDVVKSSEEKNTSTEKGSILLEVAVDKPEDVKDTGYARFKLTPKQEEGILRIINVGSDTYVDYHVVDFLKNTLMSIELEVGNYSATYYSEAGFDESNTVIFPITNKRPSTQSSNNQPIIDTVTASSVWGVTNDKYKDYISYYDKNRPARLSMVTQRVNGKNFTVSGLIPDEEYVIFSHNMDEETGSIINQSKHTAFRTLKSDMSLMDGFIDYVNYNKRLLVNPIEDYDHILIEISKNHSSNIIDSILKIKDDENIYELLLFAMKYQNEMNILYNVYNENTPKKNISNPFFNTVDHAYNVKKSNYMRIRNNKSSFVLSTEGDQTYEYTGKSRERIYTYDIDEYGMRGPKYDFSFIPMESRWKLSPYLSCNVLQNTIINPNSHLNYVDYYVALKFLALQNKKQDRFILDAPYCTFEDNMLISNIDYLDKFAADDTFLLCISEITESLDYTPVRKILVTASQKQTKHIGYDTGIMYDHSYLIWIEDMENNVISKPTILNTKIDEVFDELYAKEISDKLQSIKKYIAPSITNTFVYDSVFAYLESTLTYEKDIHENVCMESLKQLTSPYDLENIILEIYKHKFINASNKTMCSRLVYDTNTRTVTMEEFKNCKLSIHEYNVDNDLVDKTTSGYAYTLTNTDLYTVMFVTDNTLLNTQGIIVFNNLSGSYAQYGIEIEVIK